MMSPRVIDLSVSKVQAAASYIEAGVNMYIRNLRMAMYRPKSILRLILIGFGVAILPLLIVLITAEVYVDRLTKQGRETAVQAAQAVQSSHALVEQITAMERNASQFEVLQDPTLYDVYVARRDEFMKITDDMQRLKLNDAQNLSLKELVAQEQQIYEGLNPVPHDFELAQQSIEKFLPLSTLAHSILNESSRIIEQDLSRIQQEAVQAQRVLLLQSLAMIPAAIMLSALFIVLIARPLRQIDHAIRQLGEGKFETGINIEGPEDLRELGKKLDWMRLRIIELENQKVTFLRHVSHELKTPLTSIREGSELLNEQLTGSLNRRQLEITQVLKENSIQLQKLIEDLLNFSNASSQMPLRKVSIYLHQLIQEVIKEHRLPANAKELSIELALNNIELIGDREKIKIILDNLLSNAIKYSPKGGKVGISLSTRGDNAVIDVRDQGPGVRPDERMKIFDAFYQGQADYRGHVKGTGLGLSIVREYVNAHDGTVEVVDVDAEKGAHFRITLPVST